MTMLERRLRAEWNLLLALVERNPTRLDQLHACDTALLVTLHGPPVASADQSAARQISSHDIRIEYPVHFPAVPMELYLRSPVLHPNVHPQTGFVCLWNRHRVSNTVEHALHKTVAMLSGRLYNSNAPHVMQPQALAHMPPFPPPLSAPADDLLMGVECPQTWFESAPAIPGRKSRLS